MFKSTSLLNGKCYIQARPTNNSATTFAFSSVFILLLWQACKENLAAVEIVNLLIEEGAPLALRNTAGETPLDLIFKHVQNPVAVLQSKVFDEQIKVGCYSRSWACDTFLTLRQATPGA